jgi:phosphonate transport system substrate-binding protein
MARPTHAKDSRRLLRIGAVAYDPKVVTIWEGFKSYLHSRAVEIDYILYSTYDAQVDATLAG